jgi:hypothetical protein
MKDQPRTVLLSEIQTVRVVCQGQGCGHVIEGPLTRLGRVSACPACKQPFRDLQQDSNPLEWLCQVVDLIRSQHTQFILEFVLPAEEETHREPPTPV